MKDHKVKRRGTGAKVASLQKTLPLGDGRAFGMVLGYARIL